MSNNRRTGKKRSTRRPKTQTRKKTTGPRTQAKAQSTRKPSERRNKQQRGRRKPKDGPTIKLVCLGGIGEIGKNMMLIEYKNDIIMIDAGMMFPGEDLLGVDYVIPDITYLKKNIHKLKAVFITHGHEDHIGALPYILEDIDAPIYSSTLTSALIEAKLSEYPKLKPRLLRVKEGNVIRAGVFGVEFIKVSHSIDDAMGLAITTPAGVLVHTGDFKIDFTPVGGKAMDLNRFAELGNQGVLALMSDSTNAELPGFSMSESQVGETFVNYFRQAKGRIIVASFASNVHRIQQVIDTAKVFNRKVCLSGRSMLKYVKVAREIGYLRVDDNTLIEFNDLKRYRDNQVVILTTGSQGERMSGLVRMAQGQHHQVKIKSNDLVIISASPIPGNEKYVGDVINKLYRRGAKVINDATDMVHVSGHACREELKLMLSLVKPKFFIPVHGEYRHLYHHAELAEKMGIQKNNVFITENGQIIEMSENHAQLRNKVPSGDILIDGLGVGDVGNVVLRDRRMLSSDGLYIIVVPISADTGELLGQPDVVSRGFVYMKESEDLINGTVKLVEKVVSRCCKQKKTDWQTLQNAIKKDVSSYLYKRTNRNPMIFPIIIEI